MEIEKKRHIRKIKETTVSRCQKFLNDKIQKAICEKGLARVAIFTHPSPDPDAVGSQMALAWMLRKAYENIEVDCFYDGCIT